MKTFPDFDADKHIIHLNAHRGGKMHAIATKVLSGQSVLIAYQYGKDARHWGQWFMDVYEGIKAEVLPPGEEVVAWNLYLTLDENRK